MRYTHAFEQIDPHGDTQLETEEAIAFLLFTSYGEMGVVGQSLSIVNIIDKAFGGLSTRSIIEIAKIVSQTGKSIRRWEKNLESPAGPNEGECQQESKELLLLILSYAHPDYVEQEEGGGEEDA